jgi:hypothetical protein
VSDSRPFGRSGVTVGGDRNVIEELYGAQEAPRASAQRRVAKRSGSAEPPAFHDPEPCPEPVNGSRLVDLLTGFVTRYAVLPTGAALVLVLWAIATWLSDVFDAFPYLAITSPQQRCGKSRILELLEYLCRRTLLAANISAAALFRVVQEMRPTLLIDEAQQLRNRDENSAAIHDLLCSGYRRGAFAIRMGGPHNDELRRFSVFCPKAIALIGRMTPILMDRSIEIRMRRRTKTERIDRFRFARGAMESEPLRSQIVRWAADHLDEISEAYLALQLPEWLEDREAELWSPLLAVASVAIPDRIGEVENIALGMAGAKAAADDSIGVRLLADLRVILEGQDFTPTREIVDALSAIEDAPWCEYRAGKPITAKGLADLLKPFGIEPEKRRHEGQAGVRGYSRHAFGDAWERYLHSSQAFNPPQAPQPLQDKGLLTISEAPQNPPVADGESAGNASGTRFVAGVADQTASKGVRHDDEAPEDPLVAHAHKTFGADGEGKGRGT